MNSITLRPGTLSRVDSLDFILLDGSSSMMGKWWPMLEAIDTYVAGLRAARVSTHLKLSVFDTTDLNVVHRDCPISEWRTFAEAPIGSHFGGTPLYDAINLMGRSLRDLNPQKCSILIVTDGQDYDSKTSVAQARAILDWCRAHGWQVTFMGCDFNNLSQAASLGATASNSIGVQKKLLGPAAESLAKKRANHALYGTDISFTDDERTQFGGYLAAPEAQS